MGSVETSVNGMIAMKGTDGFELENEGEKTGMLVVQTAEVSGGIVEESLPVSEEIPDENQAPDPIEEEDIVVEEEVPVPPIPSSSPATFMDYINGGCEISLSVAIDFTGSNGDPRKAGTPHYLDPTGSRNDYERAISAIGGTLAGYDSDKKIPVVSIWNFLLIIFSTHCFR